ncbi:42743_t:CDS:2, partial [Gigaspora margarita]
NENWGIRHYSQDQQTAVILVALPTTNSNESETNNINNMNDYISQARFLIMQFTTDIG